MKSFKNSERIGDATQVDTYLRTFSSEIIRTGIVITAVVLLSWGVSYADDIPLFRDLLTQTSPEERKTFSTRGYTSTLTDSEVFIFNAKNPEGKTGFSYTVDISNAYIKSYTGDELSRIDLKENQDIIAKGLLQGDTIVAHTIIIFGDAPLLEETATTTATTTDTLATTTDDIASSTEDSTTTDETATTSDSFVDTVTDTITDVVDTVVDTVTGVVSGIIDVITGTSTDPIIPPSDDTQATSTDTDEESNNTPDTPASPPVQEESVIEDTPTPEPSVQIEEAPLPEPTPEPEFSFESNAEQS